MRIPERLADRYFRQIDGGEKSKGMTRLVNDFHPALQAILDHAGDFLQIPVEKVNGMPQNFQPASPIDPRTPATRFRDHVGAMLIVEMYSHFTQLVQVQ